MIKTRPTNRVFSPEFKLEAIKQFVKYQRDVREVAQAPLTICVNINKASG